MPLIATKQAIPGRRIKGKIPIRKISEQLGNPSWSSKCFLGVGSIPKVKQIFSSNNSIVPTSSKSRNGNLSKQLYKKKFVN